MESVSEGLLNFTVGKVQGPRGPATRSVGFYNKAMAYSRDISVSVFKAYFSEHEKTPSMIDALAGTGVRGLRVALEAGPVELVLNDRDPVSAEIIEKNIELSGAEAEKTNLPLTESLAGKRFDYVDIDPYGTPAPFILPALRAVRNRGLLGIAATDTATLVGKHPTTIRRRYLVDYHYHLQLVLWILLGR